jgi:hypothetical protein
VTSAPAVSEAGRLTSQWSSTQRIAKPLCFAPACDTTVIGRVGTDETRTRAVTVKLPSLVATAAAVEALSSTPSSTRCPSPTRAGSPNGSSRTTTWAPSLSWRSWPPSYSGLRPPDESLSGQ